MAQLQYKNLDSLQSEVPEVIKFLDDMYVENSKEGAKNIKQDKAHGVMKRHASRISY